MTDYYIRSMLRRATEQGLLHGWQGPHTDARSYTVAPMMESAGEWSLERVMIYVGGLEQAGLEPLIRDSEPMT